MHDDIPFHLHGADGAMYTVDVMLDRRDEANPHYDVDLVRSQTGRYGESLEQRLTLGEYDRRDEAGVYRDSVEDVLTQEGLGGLGDAAERITQEPLLYDGQYMVVTFPPDAERNTRAAAHLLHIGTNSVASEPIAVGLSDTVGQTAHEVEQQFAAGGYETMLEAAQTTAVANRLRAPDMPLFNEPPAALDPDFPFSLSETMQPYNAEGEGLAHHVDGGGTAHWFAVVENREPQGDPYELRYFRALDSDDAGLRHDSYPVMPLADRDPGAAWPLPGLEMYLQNGDVYMAQQFAHDVADHYEQDFPLPFELPALDPKPDYYFGLGVGPSNAPSLEGVKTWMDGSERRFDTFTIAEYGMYEEAQMDEQELEDVMTTHGLEAAMNLAETMAAAGGYLDPHRADARVFFEDDAPPDPFTTQRERDMEHNPHHLNPGEVRYDFDYNLFGDDALSLEAHKHWRDVEGKSGHDFILLDLHEGDNGGQVVELFEVEVERLTALQQREGLETAMNEAERMAVENDVLNGERSDPRLFTSGPPDPFTTLRARELAAEIGSSANDVEMDTQPATPVILETIETFEQEIQRTGVAFVGEIDEQVNYSFEVAPGQEPDTLELLAQKWWLNEDGELQSQARPIHEYDKINEIHAFSDAVRLYALGEDEDRETVMQRAVAMAQDDGYIDAGQTHLFTAGPPDPFTHVREMNTAALETDELPQVDPLVADEAPTLSYPELYREFAEAAAREREANATLEGALWFEATFEHSHRELLQPLDDTVNYGVVVQDADPWTRELAVEKYWKEPGGYLGVSSLTIQTYDPEDEQVLEAAEAARQGLLEVYDERGLGAMMHQAELNAMQNGWLDSGRINLGLFRDGPPDRFETLAQQLEDEINPYWNTDGEKIEEATPESEVENSYWRLDTLPVNNPDGEPLGHALHLVVYPGVEHDPTAVGSPVLSEDEPFKMLEMAHFETTAAADKFGKEFNGYLVPGLLDGPELAVEVARLEGLSAEWKTLEGDDLKAYQNAELTLTRDMGDWHPYNPNAERDARIAAEGSYSDPIHQVNEHSEPQQESISPDYDF
ncbi:MAG: hypothetical protein SF029_18530 [bacterium]|nr:hypothetical protein [bacterium]